MSALRPTFFILNLESFISRPNVISCHDLTLSVGDPDNAAAKQRQELRSEQTVIPLHEQYHLYLFLRLNNSDDVYQRQIQSTKHKWSPKTYTQSVAMVQNLIVPYIGKRKVQELRTYDIEKFYATLAKTPCGQYVHGVKQTLTDKQKKRLLSSTSIHEVHTPVSYTHLDVYKRQGVIWTRLQYL